MSMLVIVPSRGRPENIARLLQAWEDTDAGADLIVAVDHDDPAVAEYETLNFRTVVGHVVSGPPVGMCGTLNLTAAAYGGDYDQVGFMGDDHMPRTLHWDILISRALDTLDPGIVYGNDLLQRHVIPTAVFMSTSIVNVLGYMAPPDQRHLYLDNAWKDWGERAGCLRYLDDVIIEHLHPAAGKAVFDERYAVVNSPERDRADHAAYLAYRDDGRLDADVALIQAIRL